MKQDENVVPSHDDVSVQEPSGQDEEATSSVSDLEEANQKAEETKAMLQRVQADFINFRRRSEEERESLHKFLNANLITKLLPVMDDLEMAINHASETSPDAAWLEGVRLINRKFYSLLESEGVVLIEASGKTFDPAEHEAVGFQDSSEDEDGSVVEVVRQGYKVNGRVLRASQVIVVRSPGPKN